MSQASKVRKDAGQLNVGKTVYTTETVVGTGSGKNPISLETTVTFLVGTAVGDLTLEDGVTGQVKHLIMIDDTANCVLDTGDANLLPASNLTFAADGDSVTLVYNGSAWVVINNTIAA